jgi:hypothetical protein
VSVAACVALGAALALWLALTWWAHRRLEAAERAFEESVGSPDRVEPPAGPPGGRDTPAGRWLLDGLDALSLSRTERDRLHEIAALPPERWSAADRNLVTGLARRESEALVLVERAGTSAGLRLPEPLLRTDEVSRRLITLLHASKLLLARAELAADGAPVEAGRSVTALGGLAGALQREPELFHLLIGDAVETLYLRGVHRLVTSGETPRSALERLRTELAADGRDPATERFVRTVRGLATDGAGDEAAEASRGWERLAPWLRDLARASALESFRWLAEASRDPEVFLAGGTAAPGGAGHEPSIPNLTDAVYRLRATREARRLAGLAVEARLEALTRGAYSAARGPRPGPDGPDGPAPEAGPESPVEIGLGDDGSLVLSHPAAAAAWERRWGGSPSDRRPPPYVWRLPALREAPEPGS